MKVHLKEPKADCPCCEGTGEQDTGGSQPWGAPIFVTCGCREAVTWLRRYHRSRLREERRVHLRRDRW